MAQPYRQPGTRQTSSDSSNARLKQPVITNRMNPSTAAGSIQRITATRSFVGSTQVMLPPAPEAKKLASDALG